MEVCLRFFSVAAMALVLSGIAVAQRDRTVSPVGDLYVISAKAGGVNYIEGKVSVARKDGTGGQLLKDDALAPGDRVTTGPEAKAEILLNPGSYLRLGPASSFEFLSTSLDDLRLKLISGTAIVEVLASDDFTVGIESPGSTVKLTRSGVFRFDIAPNGVARVEVWKGKIFLSDGTELGSGRAADLLGSNPSVSKFDRDSLDDFDLWSRFRAKEIASLNQRLQRDAMRSSLLNSFNNRGWNAYNSFGVWVFDPVRRMWCFLPFGSGWGSPYGYDYRFNMWYCRMPYYVYYPPVTTPTTGPTVPPNVPNATREDRQMRSITPPFQRTSQNGNRIEPRNDSPITNGNVNQTNRRNRSDDNSPRWDPGRKDSKPVSTPPPPPPTPIIVMPQSNPKNGKDN
jgi:hypothetical protein